ncbi:hypothetical protein L0337_14730, partial [candidate division KSB1 bacterium]|nr:hypothetical protein [candidate division KSB1 bacterium]
MTQDELENSYEQKAVEFIRAELTKTEPTNRRRLIEKFVLAALGSIPWVGGFLSAAVSFKAEEGSLRTDSLQTRWLEEHARKIDDLMKTLEDVTRRFENLGPLIDERIQNNDYLALVRRAFRTWDRADTKEKRKYVSVPDKNDTTGRIKRYHHQPRAPKEAVQILQQF